MVSREVEHKYVAWSTKNGYDMSQPQNWLTNVDVNSLYPWAMAQFLPIGRYKEIGLSSMCDVRVDMVKGLINSYDPSCAYFVKATINVPEELHDYFDYAPIKKGKIEPELL